MSPAFAVPYFSIPPSKTTVVVPASAPSASSESVPVLLSESAVSVSVPAPERRSVPPSCTVAPCAKTFPPVLARFSVPPSETTSAAFVPASPPSPEISKNASRASTVPTSYCALNAILSGLVAELPEAIPALPKITESPAANATLPDFSEYQCVLDVSHAALPSWCCQTRRPSASTVSMSAPFSSLSEKRSAELFASVYVPSVSALAASPESKV